jgi:hypothetical protein
MKEEDSNRIKMHVRAVTEEDCQRELTEATRQFVGPAGAYRPREAAAIMDFDPRPLESYVQGDAMPALPKLVRMGRLFGPVFADRILSLMGMTGARPVAPSPVSWFQLTAQIADMLNQLCAAAKDGRFDHMEVSRLLPLLQALSPQIDAAVAEQANRQRR